MKPPIPKAFPFRRTFEDEQVHILTRQKAKHCSIYLLIISSKSKATAM